MGFRECENQFRNRKWNCSALKKSMRRILNAGKSHILFYYIVLVCFFCIYAFNKNANWYSRVAKYAKNSAIIINVVAKSRTIFRL